MSERDTDDSKGRGRGRGSGNSRGRGQHNQEGARGGGGRGRGRGGSPSPANHSPDSGESLSRGRGRGRGQGRGRGRGRGGSYNNLADPEPGAIPSVSSPSPSPSPSSSPSPSRGSTSRKVDGVSFKLLKFGLDKFDNFSTYACKKVVSSLPEFDASDVIDYLNPSGDRRELVEKLVKSLLTHETSLAFVQDVIVPFFKWLSCNDLDRGTLRHTRDKVILVAADAHGILELLATHIINLKLVDMQPIGWFINALLECDTRKYRNNESVRQVADGLLAKGNPTNGSDAAQVHAFGSRIKNIIDDKPTPKRLEPKASASAAELQAAERPSFSRVTSPGDIRGRTLGWRHKNDCEEYQDIIIVPTAEEVDCREISFLPTPNDDWPMLDRQFRLMREDMVATLKEKIADLSKPLTKGQRRRGVAYSPATLEGITFDEKNHYWSFKAKFTLPDNHSAHPNKMKSKKERTKYWEDGRGRKVFGRNTIVMLCNANNLGKPILIGEVESRDTADLAHVEPSIGIRFSEETLAKALQIWVSSEHTGPFALVPVNIPLFMYQPVLYRLQRMPLVPFREELDDQYSREAEEDPVRSEFADAFAAIVDKLDKGISPKVQGLAGSLDEGQLQGARMALTQRVALIQGPPGTGKTYIGTYIASIFAKPHIYGVNHQRLKILCVTYTNHAVDDFCEGLMKCGITNMVRLGSRSSNPNVASFTLFNRSKSTPRAVNMDFNRRFAVCKQELENLKSSIIYTQDLIKESIRLNKDKRWSSFHDYLAEVLGNEIVEELTIADGTGDSDEEGQFQVAGKKGKKVSWDFLWKAWVSGQSKPHVRSKLSKPRKSSCWAIPPEERLEMVMKWDADITINLMNDLGRLLKQSDIARSDLENLKREKDFAVVEEADIILCTTTAAAKNEELLKAAKCDVVLVEEAGEILETHVLASIYGSAKALIMIGDHLQLRPKVENYQLRVESGRGYDFNVSLFERLVRRGFSCSTLTAQHRMHPDISHLIRPTYPQLLDAPSTLERSPVRGLPDNLRIAFVSHNKTEGAGDDAPEETTVSYTNSHEAEMTAQIVEYFKKQGYKEDQLVVLTPYLGQLRLLMNCLREAIISGRDATDLRADDPNANLDTDKIQKDQNKKGVRVSSIDNYQGEESDIIIISLVRSNKNRRMGFVGDPNRVNVLLSRARCGMIILGDSQFLTSVSNAEAKNLWTKLLAMMEAKQQLMDYFPAFCARHKKLSQIKLPSEFSKFSRDGGCDLPCTEMLECGHQCPHSCHPDISAEAHKKVRCTKPAVWTCHVGHSNKYTCCDGKPTDCRQCRKIAAEKLRIELEYEAERNRRLASQQELDQQIAAAEQRLQEKKRQHADAVVQLEKEQRIRELQLRQEEQEQETRILHQLRADEQAKALEELRMRTAKASAEETGKVNDKMEQLKHEEAVIQADTQTVSSLVNLAAAADKRDLKEFNLVLSKIDRSIHLVIANKLALSVGGAAVDWFAADLSFNGIVESAPSQLSYPLSLIAKGEYFKAREAFKAKLRAEENLTIEEQIVSIGYSLCSVLISSVKQCQQFIDEMIRVSPRLTSEIAGIAPKVNPAAIFYIIARAMMLSYIVMEDSKAPNATVLGAEAAALAVTFLRIPEPTRLAVLPNEFWAKQAAATFEHHGPALKALITGTKPTASVKPPTEDEQLCAEWEELRAKNNHFTSPAMTEVLSMPALRNLKRQLLNIASRVLFEKKRGSPVKDIGFNLRFEGNPGTGKTTVAVLYSKLLADLGVIQGDEKAAAIARIEKEKKERKAQQEREEKAQKLREQQERIQQQVVNTMMGRGGYGGNGPVASRVPPMPTVPVPPMTSSKQDDSDDDDDKKPPKSFVETSGAELVDGGVELLKEQLEQIHKAGGGVLFVDEAYMLEPDKSQPGKQVLNLLLAEMEKRRGSLIVVFAGYKKKMEDLFQYNEGLPSRFSHTIAFEDYDDEQLFNIFVNIMRKKPGAQVMKFENDDPHWCRVAIRRLGAGRGSPGFGNARSCRNLFDTVCNRQAARCQRESSSNYFTLIKEDFLGPSPADAAKNSKAWTELKAMIGLEKVKKSVEALFEVVKTNELLELEMKPRQPVALNRLFLGNPGTGKTTVAKIYAEILRDFGLLSKGDVIMKAASDFIGSVLGESQKTASAIIKSAEGSVLVIDEAYGLHGKDPYKTSVIDTIVEQVQGVPGEDKAVVLLGYREQMEIMLREANPGLQRRFQLENAFQFDDYNDNELNQILKFKMGKMGLEADADALSAAIKYLGVQRDTKPPFGNGGAVANLLSEAVNRKAARGAGTSPILIESDFAPVDEGAKYDTDEKVLFKGLIGCDEIVKKLLEFKATFKRAQDKGQDPLKKLSLNFRFVGAPGTGKTTVAKRMGRMFRGLGVLPSADVVETSGTDLVGQFVGQSAPKTRELMDKGLGKVLFIDEAYTLASNSGGFAKEAVDELVRCLTHEKYMGKMVVILAGYEHDIERLMQVNDGLRSRFAEVIHFRNFNADESCKLLHMRLAEPDVDLMLSDEVIKAGTIEKQMARLSAHPKFSNGRDIVNWAKRIEREVAMGSTTADSNSDMVLIEHLEKTMDALLSSLGPASAPVAKPNTSPTSAPPVMFQDAAPPPQDNFKIEQSTKIEEAAEPAKKPSPKVKKERTVESGYFGMDVQTELLPLNTVVEFELDLAPEQIQELAKASVNDSTARQAIELLSKKVGNMNKATQIFQKWQSAQKQAIKQAEQEKEDMEAEMKMLNQMMTIRPIVQCQVCKATAEYWAACWVAPMVIGWNQYPLNE